MQLPSNSDNNARTSRPSRYRFGNKLGTGVSGSVYLGTGCSYGRRGRVDIAACRHQGGEAVAD